MNNDLIQISEAIIDPELLLDRVQSRDAGASVLFVGTTREFTGGRQTVRLEYECYESMALRKLGELVDDARSRWKMISCAIQHRVGIVDIGEASVAIAVSSAHRADSFAAASWLMDSIKQSVPIWKQEHWADGSTQWVHPTPDLYPELDDSTAP